STAEGRFLNTKPLLGGDQVFHIAQDRFGKFWCTTRMGLARFSRKQALAALSQSSLQVERYGEAQSLPTTNFGLVTSASGATDPQGRMWFPGLQGLVSVNPADFESTPRPPAPLILAINTDGTPRDLNRPQNIPPGLKKIEFVFQTIRLDSLGGDFCRLKMQGFDPDWIPCNESRTAQYTNLSPSNYEFLLQTSSQADQWNGKQLSIPLTIEAAYYQLLWVRILALLSVCAFVLHRYNLSLKRTRLLEEKVEERTAELESAMLAAQSSNRAKTEFLATMSHEIRTPMNGVLGAVQILNGSPLNSDQQKLVNVIRQSGEDLVGIVDDILSLSKVEAGKLTLEKTTVSIPALCENLVALFRPKAEAKGIQLSVALEDSAPTQILSDPQRLRQILLNLIGNAVKFTEQGHVLLRVNSDPAAQTICFHIEDTGLGIPKDKIATLFDPFVQADSSTTRRFGGSGLGLAIVHRFVEAMKGSIEIESEPGRGSSFRVRFPLETAPDMLEPLQPTQTPEATFAGLRVLIAEDNPVNQMVFERMLIRLGCHVRIAKNGREALTILREESANLILMDCQMPELDGYQATTEIRSWGGIYENLPIIALTASAMLEDRQRCLDVGMNDFLSKPLILATLQEKLAHWSKPAAQATLLE
ncbi:MAG: ATP-binding protein, partial [Acidobacteria bacterium]|nr:ATP-binding protein [Acidobacteriota bacterium]